MGNLATLPEENLILFDWLTFSIKTDDLDFVMELIGMKDCPWEQIDRYMDGYPNRKFFGGVSVMYGATEEMGICVNMSGQGCRTYESYGKNDWTELIRTIYGSDDINITRLDMAFDDHSGLLDIDEIWRATLAREYVSKAKNSRVTISDNQKTDIQGKTVEIGSNKSDMLIRIYDKGAERGYDADTHWIRIEMQMRNKIATGFCSGLLDNETGTQFRGVLHNYLRFVEPSETDSNRNRWPMTEYWEKLIDGVEQIRCWSAPGVDYNMSHLENFVIRQAGNAIDVYLKVCGWHQLMEQLRNRDVKMSPKYKRILEEYGIRSP